MKLICAIVTAALLMHLQCVASCFGDSFRSTANQEQPCPQHSNAPPSQPQDSNDANSRCGQGSLIEAKLSFGSKDMLTGITAVVPQFTTFVSSFEVLLAPIRAENPPCSHASPAPSILRI